MFGLDNHRLSVCENHLSVWCYSVARCDDRRMSLYRLWYLRLTSNRWQLKLTWRIRFSLRPLLHEIFRDHQAVLFLVELICIGLNAVYGRLTGNQR